MTTIILGIFLLVCLVNLIYFVSFFSFALAKEKQLTHPEIPISVIVCAKNEAENLKNFLPAILEQDYPLFEVIVINDASTDETKEIIESFQQLDGRIKLVDVVNNEAFWANKKYALTLGIKKARYRNLLFTDADCAPQSKQWIREMAAQFQPNTSIVLGYGGYFKNKGSFLNKLIRFETMLTAIQYFSYAKLGNPYMGVGRNLAYTSDRFYELKGFASHLQIRSGDDDLFVNEAGNANNTSICFSKNGFTRSVPKSNFSEWIQQKKRHVSVAKHYKTNHKLLLSTFFLFRIAFWFLMPIALIFLSGMKLYIALGSLVLKLIIEGFVYFKSANKLDEKDTAWLFPLLDPFLIFTQFFIFISNAFSKPTHWK